jgi:hypothetical protein
MSLILNSGFTIGPGVVLDANPDTTLTPVTAGLRLNLDARNPASYPGSGTTWTDTISSISFTLNNGPTYNSNNGGYLEFVPSSGQWADSTAPLPSLNTWTVETWHYFTGVTTGSHPCLVTETFTGGVLNYALGYPTSVPSLQAGFYNGGWQVTPSGYTLTPDAWYQIVGTYDGDTIKLYVNNTLINQTSYTYIPTSSASTIRLMNRWDSADYWGGKLSIVRIYDTALDLASVTQNYNADRARFGL